MDILEEIVQQNYIKIINDVNEVLKGVEEKSRNAIILIQHTIRDKKEILIN